MRVVTVEEMARDPWLDNVKLTLVALVVVGHSWALLGASALESQLYDFVYFWHMPAFVLLSGHLSKSFVWDRRHLSALVTTILVPYLIFEPAIYWLRKDLGQNHDGTVWLEPHWVMWYLCALFLWRLATPVLKKHWLMVPASVVVSLVGGMSGVLLFGMPRVLGLLPFFVLGLHLRREHLSLLTRPWARAGAVVAMVWIFVVAGTTDEWAGTAFLRYDVPYADMGFPALTAMEVRLRVLAIGLLGAAAVLALIPRRQSVLSSMGSASMVVYLFHGFVVRYADAAGWVEPWRGESWLSLPITASTAIALALVLAAPPVARRLTWLADPVGSVQRLRRQRSAARAAEQTAEASRRSAEESEQRRTPAMSG